MKKRIRLIEASELSELEELIEDFLDDLPKEGYDDFNVIDIKVDWVVCDEPFVYAVIFYETETQTRLPGVPLV